MLRGRVAQPGLRPPPARRAPWRGPYQEGRPLGGGGGCLLTQHPARAQGNVSILLVRGQEMWCHAGGLGSGLDRGSPGPGVTWTGGHLDRGSGLGPGVTWTGGHLDRGSPGPGEVSVGLHDSWRRQQTSPGCFGRFHS
ncbi:unnamed protein product [Gadus morhua 'NCC']